MIVEIIALLGEYAACRAQVNVYMSVINTSID